MGACLSCLTSGSSTTSTSQPSERHRLLSPNGTSYTTYQALQTGQHAHGGDGIGAAADGYSPADRERENRALAGILANASDNLIDIYALDSTMTVSLQASATIEQRRASGSPSPPSNVTAVETKPHLYARLLAASSSRVGSSHGERKEGSIHSSRSVRSIRERAELDERLKKEREEVLGALEDATKRTGTRQDGGLIWGLRGR